MSGLLARAGGWLGGRDFKIAPLVRVASFEEVYEAMSVAMHSLNRRRLHWSQAKRQAFWGLFFVMPAVLFFIIMRVYPVLSAVWVSFTDWTLLSPPQFVGWRNYVGLLRDEDFIMACKASVYFAVGAGIPTAVLSLMAALLVNRKLPGRGFFRTALFVPAVISWIVTAILWKIVYLPDTGLYLLITEPFGIRGVRWLVNRDLAMPAAIIMAVWKQVAPNMVIFLAGLQALPEEMLEAARVDGANSWQMLRHITLPLLKPTTLFVTTMLIISGLEVFTPMYVLTGGGPAHATRVISLLVYQQGFQFYRMGQASAVSIVMLAAIMTLTILNLRLFRGESTD